MANKRPGPVPEVQTAPEHQQVLVDFYAVLGLPRDATRRHVSQAYIERAARAAKGNTSLPWTQELLKSAYEVLSNPTRRGRYDDLLAAWHGPLSPADGDCSIVRLRSQALDLDTESGQAELAHRLYVACLLAPSQGNAETIIQLMSDKTSGIRSWLIVETKLRAQAIYVSQQLAVRTHAAGAHQTSDGEEMSTAYKKNENSIRKLLKQRERIQRRRLDLVRSTYESRAHPDTYAERLVVVVKNEVAGYEFPFHWDSVNKCVVCDKAVASAKTQNTESKARRPSHDVIRLELEDELPAEQHVAAVVARHFEAFVGGLRPTPTIRDSQLSNFLS